MTKKNKLKRISLQSSLKVSGPSQKIENEIVEVLRALEAAVRHLEQGYEAKTLDLSTYLSILASLRSCFSEIRQDLKRQGLDGTEVTALNELQMTLFSAGSRPSSNGGRY